MSVALTKARSQLLTPADRTLGSSRETLPKVNGAGAEKSAVLNHLFKRLCADPPRYALCPFEFGREPPPREPVVFGDTVRCSGSPLWKVAMPSIAHPEISFEAARLTCDR